MWYWYIVVCVVVILAGGLMGLYFLLAPLVKDEEARLEASGIYQKGEGEPS